MHLPQFQEELTEPNVSISADKLKKYPPSHVVLLGADLENMCNWNGLRMVD